VEIQTPHVGRISTRHSMSKPLIFLILLYRATFARFLGGQCRFHPTCSQYAIDSITRYGPVKGSWRAAKRILRCHPWGGHGYDPA
jgi:putative membrane protein insertion efficiency factor